MLNMRRVLLAALVLAPVARATAQAPAGPVNKQRVTFRNGGLSLVGFLFKPAGAGPFPTLIWNHGSEKNPGTGPQFDSVAAVFVPAGYAVFAPMRRGHGFSEGTYISDSVEKIRTTSGANAAGKLVVQLMESEQLDDQLAGLAYAKTLPFVDTTRLVVAGCSYGGIQTLLAAERGAGFKAAVSISPAALSWAGNPFLQDRLKRAIATINIPVMLIQPAKDQSLEPSKVLGAEFQRLRKQYVGKVYPATGPEEEQKHCFGGARGMHVWAKDVVAYLKGIVH